MRSLTTTDVARRPLPGSVTPTAAGFSPDGATLTYLLAPAGSLDQELLAVDVASGRSHRVATPGRTVVEDSLPLEERLRRERARELATGVTRYAWAGRAARILVPMSDGLWVLDDLDGAAARLVVETTDQTGPLLDARLSPDGARIGYVAAGEVHVSPVDGGSPVAVTNGAEATGRANGSAEFIAQEEMGRPYGFWFSDDGTLVTFCEVDESAVPTYRIVHQGSDDVGPEAREDHAYPFAGEANAAVRVGVVTADGTTADDPVWLDLGCSGIDDDRYVARVDWAPDATVVVQIESRDQQRLDVVRFDPSTGSGTLLWTETSNVWINLHDHLRFLDDGSFLWSSERSGFRHLEVRAADGALVRTLTAGDWVVTSVAGVGDGAVWFLGTRESALERHLHRVPLDGSSGPERLTTEAGVHRVVVHPSTGAWVDTWSAPGATPRTVLHRADGTTHVLHDSAQDPRVAAFALVGPDERIVVADDGTPLHAAVYLPDGDGPHPTIVSAYGGPHAQMLTRSWGITVALRAQYLRQQGFCVAVIDNRGSTDRGVSFESHLRHGFGTVEVDDQVALVRSLVDDGTTDPERVGIYGWSYGGYLSALCLARRPDVFQAACAGAPVTSWDGYDTHYTERYLGTPAGNPDGYARGSVMTHVDGFRDRALLLIHGLIDENVHFRHTARLINALIRAGIDHELFLFPDERHVPRGEADRSFMEDRIAAFFRTELGGSRPESA
ncbi:MAG: DPP IV N-terminal domain-containing protein [Acidimicrobiales bacterium]